MKKWKKLLIPAVCLFLMQAPVIASAESDTTTGVAAETTVTPTPVPAKNGVIKEKNKLYYYKNGVKQKNCWDPTRTYYFDKKGVAVTARKAYGSKQNIVTKKIGKKTYGFDVNGRKVKNGVYADAKGKAYYFDKKGVLSAKKSKRINAAAKPMSTTGSTLRKLLGKPVRTKSAKSCYSGVKKDYRWIYSHIIVQVGKQTNGAFLVYGIQAR